MFFAADPTHDSHELAYDSVDLPNVNIFSEFALNLYAKPVTTQAQMDCCMKMIKKPATDTARFDRIWATHVMALKDVYEMTP